MKRWQLKRFQLPVGGKRKKEKQIGGGKIQLYVQEKNLHEIIILFLQVFIGLNKYGIKRWIQSSSVRHIVYQQCISKVSIKIHNEKIKKVLMIKKFLSQMGRSMQL
jgi:hypothetical protein